jgi:hypothetical protein
MDKNGYYATVGLFRTEIQQMETSWGVPTDTAQ